MQVFVSLAFPLFFLTQCECCNSLKIVHIHSCCSIINTFVCIYILYGWTKCLQKSFMKEIQIYIYTLRWTWIRFEIDGSWKNFDEKTFFMPVWTGKFWLKDSKRIYTSTCWNRTKFFVDDKGRLQRKVLTCRYVFFLWYSFQSLLQKSLELVL